jgi:hypothetical protein
MSAPAAEVEGACLHARWNEVVLQAASLTLDWWSQADTPADLNEAIGAWFRRALWAELVWRADKALRAEREETGQWRQYCGPGDVGEVVRGPGGTSERAAAIREAAAQEARALGLAELLLDTPK